MKTYHFLISGKVQGVGFRHFTNNQAFIFKLNGWVRNLTDGRVEVLLQGEDSQVQQFIEALKKGPNSFSRVSDIESHERDIDLKFDKFDVIETGEREWDDY